MSFCNIVTTYSLFALAHLNDLALELYYILLSIASLITLFLIARKKRREREEKS